MMTTTAHTPGEEHPGHRSHLMATQAKTKEKKGDKNWDGCRESETNASVGNAVAISQYVGNSHHPGLLSDGQFPQ